MINRYLKVFGKISTQLACDNKAYTSEIMITEEPNNHFKMHMMLKNNKNIHLILL